MPYALKKISAEKFSTEKNWPKIFRRDEIGYENVDREGRELSWLMIKNHPGGGKKNGGFPEIRKSGNQAEALHFKGPNRKTIRKGAEALHFKGPNRKTINKSAETCLIS